MKKFKKRLRWLADRIEYSQTLLKPKHLLNAGWVKEEHTELYYNPCRTYPSGRIYIGFGFGTYAVYQGLERTFIAGEFSLEWLETYLMLMSSAIAQPRPFGTTSAPFPFSSLLTFMSDQPADVQAQPSLP